MIRFKTPRREQTKPENSNFFWTKHDPAIFWESASRILAFARSRKHGCNSLVAMNYMHSHMETKRTLIQSTNIQCHHSSPNDTLEIELPEYGTINSIRLMMHLTEGVGEASFKQDIEDLIQIVKAQNLHAGQRSKPHILY